MSQELSDRLKTVVTQARINYLDKLPDAINYVISSSDEEKSFKSIDFDSIKIKKKDKTFSK